MSWTYLDRPGGRCREGRGSRGRTLQCIRSTNQNFLWDVGEGSLRDHLALQTWLKQLVLSPVSKQNCPRTWNMAWPLPSYAAVSACTERYVTLGHEPSYPLPMGARTNLWLMNLCPQEEGVPLQHVLSCLSLKCPWMGCLVLPCSKQRQQMSAMHHEVAHEPQSRCKCFSCSGSYITPHRHGTSPWRKSEILTEEEQLWQKLSQQYPPSHLVRRKGCCYCQRQHLEPQACENSNRFMNSSSIHVAASL